MNSIGAARGAAMNSIGAARGAAMNSIGSTLEFRRVYAASSTHARRHTRTRTHTHTCTHAHAYTPTHTRTHAQACTNTGMHAHTPAHARTHTRTHTRTRTHPHAHTRAHTQTRTRTHAQALGSSPSELLAGEFGYCLVSLQARPLCGLSLEGYSAVLKGTLKCTRGAQGVVKGYSVASLQGRPAGFHALPLEHS